MFPASKALCSSCLVSWLKTNNKPNKLPSIFIICPFSVHICKLYILAIVWDKAVGWLFVCSRWGRKGKSTYMGRRTMQRRRRERERARVLWRKTLSSFQASGATCTLVGFRGLFLSRGSLPLLQGVFASDRERKREHQEQPQWVRIFVKEACLLTSCNYHERPPC